MTGFIVQIPQLREPFNHVFSYFIPLSIISRYQFQGTKVHLLSNVTLANDLNLKGIPNVLK